jgi:hypothetical protein
MQLDNKREQEIYNEAIEHCATVVFGEAIKAFGKGKDKTAKEIRFISSLLRLSKDKRTFDFEELRSGWAVSVTRECWGPNDYFSKPVTASTINSALIKDGFEGWSVLSLPWSLTDVGICQLGIYDIVLIKNDKEIEIKLWVVAA